MFKGLLVGLLVVFTLQSQAIEIVGAQGFKRYKGTACPVIPSEYEDALSSIDRLTNHVIKESGCEALNSEIKGLAALKGKHKKFLDLVRSKEGLKLEAEDAVFVQDYAQNATVLISNVFSAMKGSSCPLEKSRAQKAQLTETLTNLAYGIVNGISHVAGPYGTPILIGANALKGVVFGLQDLKGKDDGYTFDQTIEGEAEARTYAKSLCIFFNFRKEFENLVQPKAYYEQLTKIKITLSRKVNSLKATCSKCSEIHNLFLRSPKATRITTINNEIIDGESSELESNTVSAVESLDWVNNQLKLLQSQQQGLRGLGPALLMEKIMKLEEFLVDSEANEFISWITTKAERRYFTYLNNTRKRFGNFIETFLGGVIITNLPSVLYKLDRPFLPGTGRVVSYDIDVNFKSLHGFYSYLKGKYATGNRSHYLEENLDSYYQKSIREMLTYEHFVTATEEYCSFFKMSNLYSPVRKECTKASLTTMGRTFEKEYYADPANAEISFGENDFKSWDESLQDLLDKENEYINSLK